MGKIVDLTKVNLSGKSLIWMTIAFTMVIVVLGIARVGAVKVNDMVKGATRTAAEEAEEF